MLQEGPWPAKAYFDALIQARQRDASYYFDYGYTRPRVISRGPVPPAADQQLVEAGSARPQQAEGPEPTLAEPLGSPPAEELPPAEEALPTPADAFPSEATDTRSAVRFIHPSAAGHPPSSSERSAAEGQSKFDWSGILD